MCSRARLFLGREQARTKHPEKEKDQRKVIQKVGNNIGARKIQQVVQEDWPSNKRTTTETRGPRMT